MAKRKYGIGAIVDRPRPEEETTAELPAQATEAEPTPPKSPSPKPKAKVTAAAKRQKTVEVQRYNFSLTTAVSGVIDALLDLIPGAMSARLSRSDIVKAGVAALKKMDKKALGEFVKANRQK
jgi:hypothetical protein